ncbi:MAG: 16S rRNA (adenine(1518)-N(6)/adenine(1519)-N(6))-dimethyltransferase RsmA [Promethearchaeota archaeon]
MNIKKVKLILKDLNLRPKKHLGQNFLIEKKTLNKVISEAQISNDDIILEIGPGLGALTEKLVKKAKKVYAIEIDPILSKYISERFSKCTNIEIINADILEIEVPFHNKVVSNIPYKITGPIFEKIFFKEKAPEGTLIIEKKITERIFFDGDYKNYSRITIAFNSFMNPISRFEVPRNSFFPIPKIDLSLINITPKSQINQFLCSNDEKMFYLKFIAGIMPYKNKNIVNAIELFLKRSGINNFNKSEFLKSLQTKKLIDYKVHGLQIDDFIDLCKSVFYFYKIKKKSDSH